MKNTRSLLLGSGLLLATLAHAIEPTELEIQSLPESTLNIVSAQVKLPAGSFWEVKKDTRPEAIKEIYLTPSAQAYDVMDGERMREIKIKKRIDTARWDLRGIRWGYLEYAKEHDGAIPEDDSLLTEHHAERIKKSIHQSPWSGMDRDQKGPFIHVCRDSRFVFKPLTEKQKQRPHVPAYRTVNEPKLLAFELRPYVDDGKHWVLMTDGSIDRKPIDPELLKRYGQTINPVLDREKREEATHLRYELVFTLDKHAVDPLTISILADNKETEDQLIVNVAHAKSGTQLKQTLSEARSLDWSPYTYLNASHILSNWDPDGRNAMRRRARRRGTVPSTFSILGGSAAIEETMQLQPIRLAPAADARTIPVDALKGVKAESHDYAEMLGETEVIVPDILKHCPEDRMAVYVPDAPAAWKYIDAGTKYIARLGDAATGRSMDYQIVDRQLARLGMPRAVLQMILDQKLVTEAVLLFPDPLFIEGTDITVLAKVKDAVKPILLLLGANATEGAIGSFTTPSGHTAHISMQKDLLLISSQKSEIERCLTLPDAPKLRSLAKSPEFRFMQTKLPISTQTRAFVYLSDPFLRRTTGPRVKIAQARRMKERARMEMLTSAAILASADGYPLGTPPVKLRELEYLKKSFPIEGLTLNTRGAATSATYGTLGDFATLLETPVTKVSEEEKENYDNYVQNYNRYWRQFYDPIAIRFSELDDAQFELQTYILPLIDSSIYNEISQVMVTAESGRPIKLPVIDPEPVMMVSANLHPAFWGNELGEMLLGITEYTGLDSRIFDTLGPGVHLAIHDADPVLALGSGDILGAFHAESRIGGFDEEMMIIPVILTVLTRPSSAMIETRDPEAVRKYLETSFGDSRGFGDDWVSFSTYRVGDEQKWVLTIDLAGIMKLRYGISVEKDWLVIQNIPWSNNSRITGAEVSECSTAYAAVNPASCIKQSRALFTAAHEKLARNAYRGNAILYPLVWAGIATEANMLARHRELFGYAPRHPVDGTWRVTDRESRAASTA